MPDFECPDCGGGFALEAVTGDLHDGVDAECPWCGRALDVAAVVWGTDDA